MKRMGLLGLLASLLLCGCSTSYVMKLSNGTQIQTANKPKLKGSTYYYKDAHGNTITIPQSRVLEIEPASMKSEDTTKFTPPSPKKNAWWHFW
jgi:hypothetical protein